MKESRNDQTMLEGGYDMNYSIRSKLISRAIYNVKEAIDLLMMPSVKISQIGLQQLVNALNELLELASILNVYKKFPLIHDKALGLKTERWGIDFDIDIGYMVIPFFPIDERSLVGDF